MHTRSKMKHGRYAALLAAALVAGSVTQVRAAPPPKGEAEAKQLLLVVDVGGLEELLAQRLGSALDERLRDALREDGVAVVDDGVDTTIEVRVEMPNVELRTYLISVAAIVDERREVVADAVPCEACTEAQVVETALGQLDEAVARVPAPVVEVLPAVVIEPVVVKRRDWDRRLDLGPVGFAGAASIVGGVATVGAGVLVWTIRPGEPKHVGESTLGNSRSVGLPLMIGGGTAVLLGVVAVVVDTQVLGPRRRRVAGVDVSVDVSPTSAGLWMTGSF